MTTEKKNSILESIETRIKQYETSIETAKQEMFEAYSLNWASCSVEIEHYKVMLEFMDEMKLAVNDCANDEVLVAHLENRINILSRRLLTDKIARTGSTNFGWVITMVQHNAKVELLRILCTFLGKTPAHLHISIVP